MTVAEALSGIGDSTLSSAKIDRWIRPLFGRHLREQDGWVYLANHSLGRPLDETADDVQAALDAWYRSMDGAWGPWMAEMDAFRGRVAHLVGLPTGDCVVPKSTVGQGLRAVMNALPADRTLRPLRVVATRGEFDSLDFILKAYAEAGRAEVTWVEPSSTDSAGLASFDTEAILNAITPGTDLLVVSLVYFSSGQILSGIEELAAAARSRGCLVFLDAYHAFGVYPIAICEADFIAGGCYKYVRGGTGACWLGIHPRHLKPDGLKTIDTGWFAKKDTFAYARPETPARQDGGNAWLESTPSILPLFQAKAGLALTVGLGADAIRAQGLSANMKLRDGLEEAGFRVVSSESLAEYGGFVVVNHASAGQIADRMKADRVNVDARGSALRFGPDLPTTDDEIAVAVAAAARAARGL